MTGCGLLSMTYRTDESKIFWSIVNVVSVDVINLKRYGTVNPAFVGWTIIETALILEAIL